VCVCYTFVLLSGIPGQVLQQHSTMKDVAPVLMTLHISSLRQSSSTVWCSAAAILDEK